MIRTKVLTRRIVSPDGKAVAEARSVVTTLSDHSSPSGSNAVEDQGNAAADTVDQTVTVHASASGSFSHSHASSRCASP